ncbi:MAG: hypothetical protein FWF37_04490 [Chloroflexi bacterium]|nr:hypothetical protein [Chloroflexota bacterium]
MKEDSAKFEFVAPVSLARARRVVICPTVVEGGKYPLSTSRELLRNIISGIRKVSKTDIVLLASSRSNKSVQEIFASLKYDFDRVLVMDVADSLCVEVENPLPKPFAISTFWVPSVILSSDYLITTTPLKSRRKKAMMATASLLSVLPPTKYVDKKTGDWKNFNELGIDKVLADMYFTLPFDVAIIEATRHYICRNDGGLGRSEDLGKIYYGESAEVDAEISADMGFKTTYLDLVAEGYRGMEDW